MDLESFIASPQTCYIEVCDDLMRDTCPNQIQQNQITNKSMTYENYKNGMFRVFIVLSIPLELVTYFQYDL
jgi:hypothetical protein